MESWKSELFQVPYVSVMLHVTFYSMCNEYIMCDHVGTPEYE